MSEIIRSLASLDPIASLASATPAHPGEWPWPLDPQALALCYLRNSDHARACQIKAEGIAGGGWQDAPPPVLELLPASAMTRLALDLETFGNAFAEILRDRGGRPIGLNILPVYTVTRRQAGGLRQRQWDDLRETVIDIPPEDSLHLRALCPLGHHYSVPAWAGVRAMMDLIYAAARYNARYFEGGAIPEYAVIHTGAEMSAAQRATVREFFRGEYLGVERSRRTLFMSLQEGQSIEFRPIAQHQEGEFLKLMEAARIHLPSAHGVPPRLLGIMQAGQLGGVGEVSQQMQMFQEFTLRPRQRQLLDQLQPLLQELGIAANTLQLAMPDLTPPGDDAKDLPALVQTGLISIEEGRQRLHLEVAKSAETESIAHLMAALLAKL